MGSLHLLMWMLLALYSPEVSSVRVPLPTSVKNGNKYVFLFFFMSLSSQNIKKHKRIRKNKIKKRLGFCHSLCSVGWYINFCSSPDFEAKQEDCIEGKPRLNCTTHMVRGTRLSNNHNIFYYGLPLPLLDYLRRAKNPMLQTKSLVIFFLCFFYYGELIWLLSLAFG